MPVFRHLSAAILIALTTACASTQQVNTGAPDETKVACGSFFVYDMCVTDTERDHRADYMYFADDKQIFMYRPGSALPDDMPMHRCAMPMNEDVVTYSSRLLYGDDLNLLQEMDVKRKLLLSYMAAKDEVDGCYGADSSTGDADTTASAGPDFASGEFDWGED